MKISNVEKGIIVKFLNQGGYVLDFTTADFDAFTYQSIGIPLCEKYKTSKGRSLTSYINETDDEHAIKLLSDLIYYYEQSSMKENDEEYHKDRIINYKKCRNILDRIHNTSVTTAATEPLKEVFNSDYISSQIDLMVKMQEDNPTEAIGKSKELIESCCKTILEKEGHRIEKDWDVPRLVDETFKLFSIK